MNFYQAKLDFTNWANQAHRCVGVTVEKWNLISTFSSTVIKTGRQDNSYWNVLEFMSQKYPKKSVLDLSGR